MRANRVDGNKSEIVAALRKAGAEWISCEGDPKIGFDGLVAFRGALHPVELKNGSLSPSRRRLTKGESDRAEQLLRKGVKVLVILDPEDGLRQIGAIGASK